MRLERPSAFLALDLDDIGSKRAALHLFKRGIPLDRHTEFTATSSDAGTYSTAVPSIDLQIGSYYLSVKCGAEAQRFRTIVFEVRGGLVGIGDAVHGEVCPGDWVYHYVNVLSASTANATNATTASSSALSVTSMLAAHAGGARTTGRPTSRGTRVTK